MVNTNVLIIVGIIFVIGIIVILIGILVYMLFFRKVTVLLFNSKGHPLKIIQATKKGKDLWFQKKNWTAKEGSYGIFGKKTIYWGQLLDENTITPYLLTGLELKADENWLEALNNSYKNSATKFKLGLAKYAELIGIVVSACFVCIMVLGAVKYTTDLTPVEAEAMKSCSDSLAKVAPYYAEGSKANQLIVDQLELKPKTEVPK